MKRYRCPECGHKWMSDSVTASLAWYSDGITRIKCPSCGKFSKVTDAKSPWHAKVVK